MELLLSEPSDLESEASGHVEVDDDTLQPYDARWLLVEESVSDENGAECSLRVRVHL